MKPGSLTLGSVLWDPLLPVGKFIMDYISLPRKQFPQRYKKPLGTPIPYVPGVSHPHIINQDSHRLCRGPVGKEKDVR